MVHRKLGAFALSMFVVAVAMLAVGATAQARSTGAHIFNLTGDELTITEVLTLPEGVPAWSKEDPSVIPPRKNQTLQPGEQLHIEINNPLFQFVVVYLRFSGPNGSFLIELLSGGYPDCRPSSGRQCTVDGRRVEFLESPGSVHVVNAEDIQGQAKALKNLCTKANECEFEPEKTFEAETPTIVYGKTVTNCAKEGGPDVDTTLSAKTTVETSNSVGVDIEAGFKFFKIFQAGITLKYKHERTESEEFKQDVGMHVPPEEVGWVAITAPVIRDVGEFTLKLGNTAWKINNVAFDSPDPNPKRVGNFTADYFKMTAEEYKAACSHKPPGAGPGNPPLEPLLPTSAALVQTEDRGTGSADLMRGGPESNAFRALGGHDLLRGGAGHDTLLGASGRDLIKGGPGKDTIAGGPGPDRIDDSGGPTTVSTGANAGPGVDWVDVADGRGDDTVSCGTPRTTVIVDPGDQVAGPCGQVILKDS